MGSGLTGDSDRLKRLPLSSLMPPLSLTALQRLRFLNLPGATPQSRHSMREPSFVASTGLRIEELDAQLNSWPYLAFTISTSFLTSSKLSLSKSCIAGGFST